MVCNNNPAPDSCQHANDAADKAVRKTFAILGVDVDNPKEVREFQQSLRFGETLRRAADKGFFAFASALGALMIGAIAFAFNYKTGG